MKKIYMKPLALIVTIQHTTTLLIQSLDNKTGGNADFYYSGASSGDVEGRVKEYNLWDDEW